MNKNSRRILSLFVCIMLLMSNFAAAALSNNTAETTGQDRDKFESDKKVEAYKSIVLTEQTKNLLVSIRYDVELLVVASQSDFANGRFFEHYYGLQSEDNSCFIEGVNVLKTISEYNQFVKLKFIDPNLPSSEAKLQEFSNYQLEFGDILVSCQINFDGNVRIRRGLVRAKNLFETEALKSGKEKVKSCNIENMIAQTIKELNQGRDINVAVLKDISRYEDVAQLKNYLANSKYNFKQISFSDEQFLGYDMIVIASPYRDITLEEATVLESFLNNGGKKGKTLAFFSPKEYVKLNNMYAFLSKWGINMNSNYRLSANVEQDYFVDKTRIYGKSENTQYTKLTDTLKGEYIIDGCTPMTLMQSDNVEVQSVLNTESKYLSLTSVHSVSGEDKAIENTEAKENYSLLAISKMKRKKRASFVIAGASSDMLTSHFARQHYKNFIREGSAGELCSNLDAIGEIFETINVGKRDDKSGLIKYAVSLKERGYEVSSGLNRKLIIGTAFSGVTFVLILMLGIVFVKTRRKSKVERR